MNNTREIELNNSQYDFLQCKETFSCYMGGYKAGKTFIIAYKAALTIQELKVDGLMAEPTYRMNEDLLRPALEKAFETLNMWYNWNASNSLYETQFGNILLRTQDKRNSLEGHNIGWFGLDEVDLLPNDKALENWRVLMSKLTLGKKQYGFCCGTNEGYEFIYNTFYVDSIPLNTNQYFKNNYRLFKVSTEENRHNLPDGYIERLYENYDEKLVDRYINGDFVNIKSGRAYSNFTDENKIERKIDINKPIFMSWDVNYSDRKMSTTLIQEFNPYEIWSEIPSYVDSTKSVFVAVKGFYFPNTDSEIQCQIIDKFFKEVGFANKILVYGDRVGNDRRVGASRTHYQIVSETFGISMKDIRTKFTRSIIDRVTSVNTMFKNSKGFKRAFVDIECKDLIIDLEQVVWKSNANELDSSNVNRTDPSDSLSYYFYFEHDLLKGHSVVIY